MRKRYFSLVAGLAVGCLLAIDVITAGGGTNVASAERNGLSVYGEVVALEELGSLTLEVWEYNGAEPCVDGVLPEDTDFGDFSFRLNYMLPAGGVALGHQVGYSQGVSFVFNVVVDNDQSVHYFPPIGGDSSQVGCFDESMSTSPNQMDVGTLTMEAGNEMEDIDEDEPTEAVTMTRAWRVSCAGTVDDPHYSSGAGGTIYKTRITCTGTGTGYPKTVSVTTQGALGFKATQNVAHKIRATSNYTQIANVNGSTLTFYTPKTGNGGSGCGYWAAASVWSFPGSTMGSASKVVYKDIY